MRKFRGIIVADSTSAAQPITRLLYITALLTIATRSIRPLFDLDVWWHLASGQWMWRHHEILRNDPFSFTVWGRPWIDHEWLFQIVLYAVYGINQITGVLLLKAMLLVLSAAGFLRGLPRSMPDWSKVLLVLWVFYLLRFRNMARADLVTWALFPWFLAYYVDLFQGAALNRWKMVLLVGLMGVWINCHAGFLLIWGVTAVLALLYGWEKKSFKTNPFLWLLLAYVGISLLNPYGPKLLPSILHSAFQLSGPDRYGFVEYLRTPYFGYELIWITLIQTWALFLIKTWQTRKWDGLDLTLLVIGTCLGKLFIRNIPVALFLSIPVAARSAMVLIGVETANSLRQTIAIRGTAVFGLLLLALSIRSMEGGIERSAYPVGAVNFIDEHLHPARGYNDYNFGGFLIWRLKDRGFPVFLDGRLHAIEGYRDIWRLSYASRNYRPRAMDAWNFLINHWPIEYALMAIPPGRLFFNGQPISVFAYYFPKDQWALVYHDELAALYVRRKAYDSRFLKTYEIKGVYPDAATLHPVLNHAWKDFFVKP